MQTKSVAIGIFGALVLSTGFAVPLLAQTPVPVPRPASVPQIGEKTAPVLLVQSGKSAPMLTEAPATVAQPPLVVKTSPKVPSAKVAVKRKPVQNKVAARPATHSTVRVAQVDVRSAEPAADKACGLMSCGRYVIMGVGF